MTERCGARNLFAAVAARSDTVETTRRVRKIVPRGGRNWRGIEAILRTP